MKVFLEAKSISGRDVVCHIENVEFNPEQRLIGYQKGTDIVTFEFSYEELSRIKKQAVTSSSWPPPCPKEAEAVFIGGFPGVSRLWTGSKSLSFGLYLGLGPATVVTEQQLTCRFERESWIDTLGNGLPPEGYDLGGISGGPMLIPLEEHGVWNLHLGGVISQAAITPDYEKVVGIRAHFINADGTVSRM